MKLSFSLPSKSSSSKYKSSLVKPSKEFDDKALNREDLEVSREYVNEFDASKSLSESRIKSNNLVIPTLENEWRPLKKMKNLDVPLDQAEASDLKFESVLGLDGPDDSSVAYGLNLRQSIKNDKGVDEPTRPASIEVIMLEKLKTDLKTLPEDRGFEDFEDVPVESFAAAVMKGYGWREGRGIGKNAEEDVEVKMYDRRTDKQGLGFVSDIPIGLLEKEKGKDRIPERDGDGGRAKENRKRNGDGGRVKENRDRYRNGDGDRINESRDQNVDGGRVKENRERNGELGRVKESRDRYRDGDRVMKNRDQYRDGDRVKENRNRNGDSGKVKENNDRERVGLNVGKLVRIIDGRDAGMKGTIVEKLGLDWLVLKLSKNEQVKVPVNDVVELGSKEEEKFLKDGELRVQEGKRNKKRGREVERVVEKYDNNTRDEEKRSNRLSWLMSHIRVRIISKDFKGGRFYRKKGEVVDVVGPTICDISMDGSRELIQGVSQDFLETALPRCGGPVLVLYGKHKGTYGSLVERDLDRETGVVQDAASHALLNVHLEQIAEYIGDPSYLGY